MSEKNRPIPAVVDDMLKKLWNSYLALSERDNTALMLEEIERSIQREVKVYRRERAKQHRDDRDSKRKAHTAARYSANTALVKY